MIRPIARPNRLMLPDGWILLAVTTGAALLALQGAIPAWQGATMVAAIIVFCAHQYWLERTTSNSSFPPVSDARAQAVAALAAPLPPPAAGPWIRHAGFVGVGLAALILGADLFVAGAVDLARAIGVSEAIIGLTIVAVGTSLPELATSIVAALRRQSDVAYGNILGSNMFNILAILGISALAGPLVVPPSMAAIDGPVMVAATGAMLAILALRGRINRIAGGFFVATYVAYVVGRYAG